MFLPFDAPIWFYRQPVDFRKQLNGLVVLVADTLKQNPTSGQLFVFRNKQDDVLDTERKQLQRFASKSGFHTLKTHDFILTGFIADMAHWSTDLNDSALVDELDELCARLDYVYF